MKKSNELRRNLYGLYAYSFIKSLQIFGAIGLAFFQDRGGLNFSKIFVLEGFFTASVFLLEVPTGVIADRFGRRLSLFCGGILAGLGFILFGLTTSYPLYFVANFLVALGFTCISGADKALLYDTLLEHGIADAGRQYLSRYEAFGTAGLLIGLPAGSLIAGSGLLPYQEGLSICLLLSGAAYILAGLLALFIREPPRVKPGGPLLREGLDGLLLILRKPLLRRYVANYALIAALLFFVFWFYQAVTKEIGLSIVFNGFLASGFNAFGLILLLNVARIERRLTFERTLQLTALIPAACYLALGFFVHTPWAALPLLFLLAGIKLFRGPIFSDLINRQVESRNRATVLSGVSMLERGIIALLYVPVGRLADVSIGYVFLALGTMAMAVTLVVRLPKGE